MAFCALPVELVDAILAPLAHNHAALAAAARASSLFNACATRLLYRHLALSSYANNLSLIPHLATHPHLAVHVRTFSVHLDDAEPAVVPTYSDLQRALSLMTNLMSLALYVDASTSWILTPPKGENGQKTDHIPIPGPAAYPRLEHLTCNFPFDPHIAAFLGQTPALISLTLSSILPDADVEPDPQDPHSPAHPVARIPPEHIPLLEVYTGPAYLLPTLVSRPLKAIHLSGDLALDLLSAAGAPSADEAVPLLRARNPFSDQLRNGDIPASEGTALQVMSAMTSSPPAELLDVLARAFPNLVCLRLMTTHAMWDLPDLVRNRSLSSVRTRTDVIGLRAHQTFYSHIAHTLSTLPHLSAFELAGIHWQSRTKPSSSSYLPEEKEWLSPPVVPRGLAFPAGEDDEVQADRDYDFDGAYLAWSY